MHQRVLRLFLNRLQIITALLKGKSDPIANDFSSQLAALKDKFK
jgi:hypothetical protein